MCRTDSISMAVVRWNPEALDSLIQHDMWRLSSGWEPVAAGLMDAVDAYFEPQRSEQLPRFMPGRPVTLVGERTGLRVVKVAVRSKPFRVYFRYRQELQALEIVQILHPRAR